MVNELRPITLLDDELREKAARAIRRLVVLLVEPQSIFVWNNLFFRDDDGSYYATLHDFIDIQPDCFQTAGPFRVSLYRIGDEVAATSDIHNDVGYDSGLVDSIGRQWTLDQCRVIYSVHAIPSEYTAGITVID